MKLQSVNPATEEVFGEFDAHSWNDTVGAANIAREVQREWKKSSFSRRSELLRNLAKALRKHAFEDAKLMSMEMGKPIVQSKAEIEKCAVTCEFYAEHAEKFLDPESIVTEAKKSYVRFDPVGVVLAIMPWNFPFWQVVRCAAPILAAGNGMILKHASNVPHCAMRLEELFAEAGFPEGLFKTLLIDSKSANRLIEEDLVDAVTLTGSTQAGSSVAANAGKQIKKCVLELGGSDPFIILEDSDSAKAAKTALDARMINTGQSCIAAKRFLIQKNIFTDVENYLVEHFKSLKVGDPLDESTQIGPLAKDDLRVTLEEQVKDAVSKGAKVLHGGKRRDGKGYFYEPTLLSNVTNEMKVYTEEVFGPVMSLIKVEDADEAVKIANSSEFGLGASVWTSNLELAEKMAREIESGFVGINSMVKSDPRLPFGGVKKSGFGRELGSYGIKEFVNIKTVVIN